MKIRHIKLPVLKPILVFTTQGQKCIVSEVELFTFDNFQSSHPVTLTSVMSNSYKKFSKAYGMYMKMTLNPTLYNPNILPYNHILVFGAGSNSQTEYVVKNI